MISATLFRTFWHLGTPKTMYVAIGIDGERFAIEADAYLWWHIFLQITHYPACGRMKAYKADMMLGSHRMKLRTDGDP